MTDAAELTPAPAIKMKAGDPAKRVDLWVDAFDGKYRLFLGLDQLCELESKTGFVDKEGNKRAGSIFQAFDRLSKGRYELEGQPVGFPSEGAATLDDCLETVRLALIGGGHAVVNGERVRVGPRRAAELVDRYLACAPMEDSWTLAFLMLNAVISGRPAEPHEIGFSNREAVFPPMPDTEADED